MKRLLLTAAASIAASCATAQDTSSGDNQQAQTPPPPPCQDDIHRAFDFWVGEWDVYVQNPEGETVQAGENSISIEENGCLLVERWTSATPGNTGQSYNFVDLGTGKWRQLWVAGWGVIDYSGGLTEDGSMSLIGDISFPNGNTVPFQGIWTPNDDGTVIQRFRQYNPATDEWTENWNATYRKKPD